MGIKNVAIDFFQKLELSVEAKQKKKPMAAPLLTSTPYESTVSKGKAAVPASTHPVAKETDISESSDTESDEEETKQVLCETALGFMFRCNSLKII